VKVVSVVGNRPQFIKAAPLARALAPVCDHVLVHTGQHYDEELSAVFFDELGLQPPDHRIETGSGSHAITSME
jgi:UDP-N-acetylglucosamine 2-epimerase (non-hydrolysing)